MSFISICYDMIDKVTEMSMIKIKKQVVMNNRILCPPSDISETERIKTIIHQNYITG